MPTIVKAYDILELRMKNIRKLKGKKVILISLLVVLVVAGGVAALLLLHGRTTDDAETIANDDGVRGENTIATNGTTRTLNELAALERASMDNPDSEYDQIMKGYNDLFSAAPDDQDRRFILIRQASYLSNIGRYDEALAVAKKAEAMVDDASSSSLIIIIAESKGDKQLALEYNKKILDQYDKNSPMYYSNSERTKAKIEQLEAEL